MTPLLLDTNAYTALMQGHEGIAARVRGASEVALSSIVIGELLAGFRNGTRESENRSLLQQMLAHPLFAVQPVTGATAEHYSALWMSLRARGTPIPTNDLWLAAQTLERDGELISFDRHFEHIEGIRWLGPPRER